MKCRSPTAKSGHRLWVVRENSEGEYSPSAGACTRHRARVREQQRCSRDKAGTASSSTVRAGDMRPKKHLTSATSRTALDLDAVLGRAREGNGAPGTEGEDRLVHTSTSLRAFHHESRPLRVVSAPTVRRHPPDSGPRRRHHRHRAVGEHEPEKKFRRCSTGARIGADIYGRKIANPIGQIWAGSMMLDHLVPEAGAAVFEAIEKVLQEGQIPGPWGKASTGSRQGVAPRLACAYDGSRGRKGARHKIEQTAK